MTQSNSHKGVPLELTASCVHLQFDLSFSLKHLRVSVIFSRPRYDNYPNEKYNHLAQLISPKVSYLNQQCNRQRMLVSVRARALTGIHRSAIHTRRYIHDRITTSRQWRISIYYQRSRPYATSWIHECRKLYYQSHHLRIRALNQVIGLQYFPNCFYELSGYLDIALVPLDLSTDQRLLLI